MDRDLYFCSVLLPFTDKTMHTFAIRIFVKPTLFLCLLQLICLSASAQTESITVETVEGLLKKAKSFKGNNADSMRYYARKGMRLSDVQDDLSFIGRFYHQIALAERMSGNKEGALAYLDTAEQIGNKLADSSLLSTVYNAKGRTYGFLEKTEEAITWQLKALKLAQQTGDKYIEAMAYRDMAFIYTNDQNAEQSLPYFKKALILFEEAQNQKGLAGTYLGMGNAFVSMYRSNKSYLDSGVVYYQKVKSNPAASQSMIRTTNINLAYVHKVKDEPEKALHIYQENYQIFRQQNNIRKQIIALSSMVDLHRILNRFDSARHYGEKGIRLARQDTAKNYTDATWHLYYHLSDMERAAGHAEQAHDYLQISMRDRLALIKKQNSEVLKELTIKYDVAQKELENYGLQQQNDILVLEQQEAALHRNVLLGGVAVLLIISGLVGYIALLRQREAHRQQEMRQQEKLRAEERETLLESQKATQKAENRFLQEQMNGRQELLITQDILLTSYNRKILDYKDRMLTATQDKEDLPRQIRNLVADIDRYVDESQNWQLFTQRFEKIYPGFLPNLTEKHNSLTRNEQRLCAYLKMGRSNTEVAAAMNVAVRSVLKYRQRIKDKLSLESSDEIEAYLQQF